MAKIERRPGATSQILQIFIQDSSSTTGAGLAALTSGSSGLTAYYHRDTDTTATAISLTTMTLGTFTSSGFLKIDDTNMPGCYQFCPPDAVFASGAASAIVLLKGATNMAPLVLEVDLNAQVDVRLWNGTAVATPATAGIPDVNAKNINNVATTSVTTINANQGTTQPVNFNGTGASADIKVDVDTIKTNPVANAGTVTFPTNATLASPTNITAATGVVLSAAGAAAVMTTQMTESYAALGAAPTPAQAMFEQRALLAENTVVSTTVTTKKLDGATTAATYTINSATVPTAITRAS